MAAGEEGGACDQSHQTLQWARVAVALREKGPCPAEELAEAAGKQKAGRDAAAQQSQEVGDRWEPQGSRRLREEAPGAQEVPCASGVTARLPSCLPAHDPEHQNYARRHQRAS